MWARMHPASQIPYTIGRVGGTRMGVELESSSVSSLVTIRTTKSIRIVSVVGCGKHLWGSHARMMVLWLWPHVMGHWFPHWVMILTVVVAMIVVITAHVSMVMRVIFVVFHIEVHVILTS